MRDVKKHLGKGAKFNFQLTTSQKETFIRECGFTDEELEIFELRTRGKSIIEITFIMTDKHAKELMGQPYTEGKVERRIRSIKNKINEVI